MATSMKILSAGMHSRLILYIYQRFGRFYCLQLQDRRAEVPGLWTVRQNCYRPLLRAGNSSSLKLEVVGASLPARHQSSEIATLE
jgi:hypothetical protein